MIRGLLDDLGVGLLVLARVLAMIQLMTASLAERARRTEAGDVLDTDEDVYAANLVDLLTGIIEAPVRAAPVATPVR